MLTARFSALLPEGVPEWVHLLPAGTFKAVDGRGPFTLKNAQLVIATSMPEGAQLPVDENHSTEVAAQAGQPSPARGRIVAMEARADGIWGKVEWNATGQQLLTEKAYRQISPVFTHEKDGTVIAIHSAALTNFPGLPQLKTLFTQETGMDLVQLRAALGLPDTADEAACLTAATALRTSATTHTAQLTSIAQAAGLDAATSVERMVTTLQAQRASGGEVAKMAAQVVNLETTIATMRADQGKRDAASFIDGAIKAGKPIVALRNHYIARHTADPAGVEKEIAAMVSINAGGIVVPAGGGDQGGEQPTPEETRTAKMMGLDPKKLAAQRMTREKQGIAA